MTQTSLPFNIRYFDDKQQQQQQQQHLLFKNGGFQSQYSLWGRGRLLNIWTLRVRAY